MWIHLLVLELIDGAGEGEHIEEVTAISNAVTIVRGKCFKR